MHIGIVGPIHLPSLKGIIDSNIQNWVTGMGGTPVNHQINALFEAGHKVSVFSLTPELAKGEEFIWHQSNLSIYIGPFRKRARHRCLDLFSHERKFLKEAIILAKPDVLHAHWQYEWAWAALDSGLPTLVTCHDAPKRVLKVQKDLYRLIRLFMATLVLRKAKHITAVSPYTAAGLKSFTKRSISVIPNFEPDNVFQLYKRKEVLNGQIKVAMVNNGFYGLKNVIAGVKAFVAFKDRHPDAELHLYGNGHGFGEDAYLWCTSQGISNGIFFKGAMNFDELIADFSKAHILLHTSLEESCPMVVIEAFAFGMPVVGGIGSGGMSWMIEEGCGRLVDVQEVFSIVDGLEQVSGSNFVLYSEKARENALRRFSKDIVLQKYLNLYEKIKHQI